MTTYAYFPGCSLEKTASPYHVSTVRVAQALGVELRELEDWNCCGATAYFHVDEILANTLCARNLAIAEKEKLDVVAPCSGCYKNLYFTREHLEHDPDLKEHVNYALAEDQLTFAGTSQVRHLLEVFVNDVGLEEIRRKVVRPLRGLRVAPYYGCQVIRPRKDPEEDLERVHFYEDLLEALGAEPAAYPPRLRCCGASLVVTARDAALLMVHELLRAAVAARADVIATVCPLCQMNLECYQGQVNRKHGTRFSMPVLYVTQLMGVALGIRPEELGIGRELVPTLQLFQRDAAERVPEPAGGEAKAARTQAR